MTMDNEQSALSIYSESIVKVAEPVLLMDIFAHPEKNLPVEEEEEEYCPYCGHPLSEDEE